VAVAFAELACH